jgi:putative transposase
MVPHPARYRWSSYKCNAEGAVSAFVQPYSVYQRLGNTPAARQLAYRRRCEEPIDVQMLAKIRAAFDGQVLGDNTFIAEVAERLCGT